MKRGNVAEFLTLVAESEALQRDLIDLAAEHGFEFTTGELSDDDLDHVAGGGGAITVIHPSLRRAIGGEPED